MVQANQNKSAYWQREDLKVLNLEQTLAFPELRLNNVPVVSLQNEADLAQIPEEGGCYWIWTNEPVHHKLHRNPIPESFDGGEVIYNGLTKDSIRWRIKNHLFSSHNEGWSGIGIDLYLGSSASHRKRAMLRNPGRKKVAYLENKKVTSIDALIKLNLSNEELEYVKKTNSSEYFFRNGINVNDEKHQGYEFRVYFIAGLKSTLYQEFIERNWRKEYGLPRLCSYMAGR